MPIDVDDPACVNEGRVEDEDLIDDTPAPVFLNSEDAVEVQVDDENVPMDDDDDEEEKEDIVTDGIQVEDMSKVKLESHSGPVYAVAAHLSSSNTLSILSGGGDDKAFLHRVTAGAAPTTNLLEFAHTDSVSCVAFNMAYISEDLSKTPRLAAVGAYDGAIVLYDPDTGRKLQNFEGPTDVEWLCFHPIGGTVLLAGSAADGTIWMYHTTMNKCLQVFVGHENAVTAGSFSPDGKWALSASSDGTVRIWAPRTGASRHVFRLGQGAGLTCMGVNGGSDNQLIIVGAEDGQAHVCHCGTKKVVASLRHYEHPNISMQEDEELEVPMSVEAVGFAPQTVNSNWCATGGVDGVLKIWDLTNDGQCRQICRPDTEEGEESSNGGITRLCWHPSLPLIITCTTNGTIHLWDARNGRLLRTVTGHSDVINDMVVVFVDDGKKAVIVSASDDKSVRVYEVDLMELMPSTTSTN